MHELLQERVIKPISDEELERRWKAVREVMKEKKVDFLLIENNNDYLGGYIKWFTDVPAVHAYPIIGEIAAVGSEDIVELKPGMIFSMEPGIFIPGVPGGGGVRLEDTILITEDGNEVLTKTPYDQNLLS